MAPCGDQCGAEGTSRQGEVSIAFIRPATICYGASVQFDLRFSRARGSDFKVPRLKAAAAAEQNSYASGAHLGTSGNACRLWWEARSIITLFQAVNVKKASQRHERSQRGYRLRWIKLKSLAGHLIG